MTELIPISCMGDSLRQVYHFLLFHHCYIFIELGGPFFDILVRDPMILGIKRLGLVKLTNFNLIYFKFHFPLPKYSFLIFILIPYLHHYFILLIMIIIAIHLVQ